MNAERVAAMGAVVDTCAVFLLELARLDALERYPDTFAAGIAEGYERASTIARQIRAGALAELDAIRAAERLASNRAHPSWPTA